MLCQETVLSLCCIADLLKMGLDSNLLSVWLLRITFPLAYCSARFEKTASTPWLAGDAIKMFWAESGGRGHGQWFEGTVLGYEKRAKNDAYRASPWASVSVQWRDNHTEGETYENLISPWELTAAGDSSE